MKSKSLVAVAFLLAVTGMGILLFNITTTRPDPLEKQALLVMRGIGHKILLRSGDTTSRVLPVKRITSTVFQLEFQSNFKFVPDTLVNIVHASLASGQLPLQYMVNVMECATNQIVYGYQIGPGKTTLVPCLGREQPQGCYSIQIAFSENPVANGGPSILWGVVISALGAFAFVLWGGAKGKKKDDNHAGEAHFISLGNYSFYADRRQLKNGKSTIELTDKESKLLSVLAARQNQPIDRDQLLKEVWEDDGVFVGRSLDVFISKLRKKLLDDTRVRIVNIHGKGYKLEVD